MDYNAVVGPGGFESHFSYMKNINVHVAHCCATHGCKYGNADCPVVLKTHKQKYPCEACDFYAEEDESGENEHGW